MAVELAELGLVIQDMLPSEFYKARTVMTVHSHVLSWVNPLQSTLRLLMEGYESGMRVGNTISGMVCVVGYLYAAFASGMVLPMLEEDCRIYLAQMKRFNIQLSLDFAQPVGQLVENLRGRSKNTVVLTGDVFDEQVAMSSGKTHLLGMVPRFKCYICVYFREFETGANLVQDVGGYGFLKNHFRGVGYGCDYFPFGLCSFVMARRTNKNKYKHEANLIRAELQHLVKNKCINFIHMLSILDGEYFAMIGKPKLARESYERAVIEAVRAGYLQNAGVASSRLSDFFLEHGDPSEAKYRWEQSIKYYQDWGATKVVEMMSSKLRSFDTVR